MLQLDIFDDATPAATNPHITYKHDGWQGYGHWLGTGNVKCNRTQFLPFKKALLYARSLKLKTARAWMAWRMTGARPANIPSAPHRVYKHDGWQGWGHWLGTGNVAPKDQQFLPFEKALLYARSLKLKSHTEWEAWRKSDVRPDNVPSTPHRTYKHDGWQGYGHWLGTSAVAPKGQQFLPFKKALLYARSLKLKGSTEWWAWRKSGARPANIPTNPHTTYKHGGWQGIRHWLGTENVNCGAHECLLLDEAPDVDAAGRSPRVLLPTAVSTNATLQPQQDHSSPVDPAGSLVISQDLLLPFEQPLVHASGTEHAKTTVRQEPDALLSAESGAPCILPDCVVPPHGATTPLLPPHRTTTSASSTHTVEAFLSRRVKKGAEQWKVHWKGYLASESSWEPAHTLRSDLGAAMFDVCVRDFEDLQLGRVILPWKDKDWTTVRTDLEVFYEGEGTESQDDGAWHECVLLRHHRQNHVVLWYGGEEFEGLDVSVPGVVGSSGYTWNKGVLRDNSGKVIKTRKQKKLDVRRRLC